LRIRKCNKDKRYNIHRERDPARHFPICIISKQILKRAIKTIKIEGIDNATITLL